MIKYYTGIGSRQTPDSILYKMRKISKYLRNKGYILRSGGADGADKAFESEAKYLKEIYFASDATKEAEEIAKRFHPV